MAGWVTESRHWSVQRWSAPIGRRQSAELYFEKIKRLLFVLSFTKQTSPFYILRIWFAAEGVSIATQHLRRRRLHDNVILFYLSKSSAIWPWSSFTSQLNRANLIWCKRFLWHHQSRSARRHKSGRLWGRTSATTSSWLGEESIMRCIFQHLLTCNRQISATDQPINPLWKLLDAYVHALYS